MRLIYPRNKGVFLVIALLLLLIAVAGMVTIFLSPKNNVNPITKTVAPTPPTHKPIGLCKQFENVSYPISCQKAVEATLADTRGRVENITIGPPDSSLAFKKTPFNSLKEVWRIDIKLEKPFLAPNGKEVKFLRIGVSTNVTKIIYRAPIYL